MKAIHLDSISPPWPGYPQAVAVGGFCFISSLMGLDGSGHLISGWDDLPKEGASLASGFSYGDAMEGPVGAQSWLVYYQMQSLMASLGGTLDDVLREHIYQKDKRFWPSYEKVRKLYEPNAPAPASGIGVCGGSPDGNVWITQDAIGIDPKEWKFEGRRNPLRPTGSRPVTSFYSQVVEGGPYLFVAGQIPLDTTKPGNPLIRTYEDVPEEGRFLQVGRSHTDSCDGPIASQTWFTYDNIRRILDGVGSAMEEIVNVTVFLQDIRDYLIFHEVHKHFFPDSPPALTVTEFREVGHKEGTLLEIEVTAMRPADGLERRSITKAGSQNPGSHAALAVIAGPLVFLSSLLGVDDNGRAVENLSALPQALRSIAAGLAQATGRAETTFQAAAIIENMKAILKEADVALSAVAKIVLYLEDFRDFLAFDSVCRHYFPGAKPSLSCVSIPRVSPVPGTRLCVETIAVKD